MMMVAPLSAVSGGSIGGRPAHPDPNNPRTQSIFIMSLTPGASKTDAVTVMNSSTDRQNVKIYAVDGVMTDTGAYSCRQDAEARADIGKWTTVEQSMITLDAGQKQDVNFTVSMPDSADVGEHNGCIVFQGSDGAEGEQTGNVRVRMRQAIRVVATVPGDLHRDISIISSGTTYRDHRLMHEMKLRNTGNVSADVDAKVTMKTLFGSEIYTNGGGYPVIANQQLNLSFEQAEAPLFGGWYTVEMILKYDKRAGTFGTDDAAQLVSKSAGTKTIFLWPTTAGWTIIFVLLAATAFAVVRLIRKRHAEHDLHENGHKHTVKKAETVQSIAAQYGMSWKSFVRVNHIKPPYVLEPGAIVHVPKKHVPAVPSTGPTTKKGHPKKSS